MYFKTISKGNVSQPNSNVESEKISSGAFLSGIIKKMVDYNPINPVNQIKMLYNAAKNPVKTANTILDWTLRPATRGATAILKTLTNDKSVITPESTAEKVFYGDRPIGDVTQYGKQFQEDLGFKPKSPLTSGLIGVGLASLDVFNIPGGKATKVFNEISKLDDAERIVKKLFSFKISENVAKEIAPKLVKINNPEIIAKIIKNAEIVSKVESEIGQTVPKAVRAEIGRIIETIPLEDEKQVKTIFDNLINGVAESAPKQDELIQEAKPVSKAHIKRVFEGGEYVKTNDGYGNTYFQVKGSLPNEYLSHGIKELPLGNSKVNIGSLAGKADTNLTIKEIGRWKGTKKDVLRLSGGEVIQKPYVDEILNKYPNAKPFVDARYKYSPIVFKDNGEVVGLVKPIAEAEIENPTKFIPKQIKSQPLQEGGEKIKPKAPKADIQALNDAERDLVIKELNKYKKSDKFMPNDFDMVDDWVKRAEKGKINKEDVYKIVKFLDKKGINVFKNSESLGVFAGFETDENGKIKFSPTKAIAGIAGMKASKSKPVQKALQQGLKKAKSIGKKIGSFKTKAKDRIRINNIYNKFKNKQETLKNFRYSVRQYASDLPINMQRKILSRVKFSELKSGTQLNKILDDVDRARKFVATEAKRKSVLKEVMPLLRTLKDKGKMGVATEEVRKFGLKSREAIKKASLETLQKLKKSLTKALDTTPHKIDYDAIDFKKMDAPNTSLSKTKEFFRSVGVGIEKAFGSASTNVEKYGGKALKYAKEGGIRGRRFEILQESKKAITATKDFIKGIRKIEKKWFNKEESKKLAYALFNQDFDTAKQIFKKYKMEDAFQKVTDLLADIHKRANEVGIKVGKMPNYFPRVVADFDGLFKAYNDKFGKTGRSYFDKLLKEFADTKLKKVEELTIEDRANVLTSALRGYGSKINAGVAQAQKARRIAVIPPEFMKFYHSPEESLIRYISNMNDKIAMTRIIGMDSADAEKIGSLVDGLQITPKDAQRLKEVLTTVLSPQGKEAPLFNLLRKSATLTLLGHIQSTITNLGDIVPNVYKHGLLGTFASFFDKRPIKRDALFAEITTEFKDANFITRVLKMTGFDKVDKIMNQSFMGNAFRENVRLARKGRGAKFEAFAEKMKAMFGKRADEVMEQMKKGIINSDTEYAVFNDTLDISPRAIEELPEFYIKHPNARLFYAMKSWSLKTLDIYRNDVVRNWKKNKVKSIKNFVILTGALTMAGATTDQIKDWWFGKKDDSFSDKVFANLFKIVALTKYDASTLQKDGLGRAILAKIFPPTRLVDDVSRDIINPSEDGLYSTRDIPVIGTEIYNRFGKGSKKQPTIKEVSQNLKGMSADEKKLELVKLKKQNPSKYARLVKELKWEKIGITDKERSFASMDVYNGNRAKAIAKYIRSSKNKALAYKRLKAAGIISDDVKTQLTYILKNNID